ncbi:MAG: Calx-beta domain-containing protein, partial [Myxococcota bacterium]
TATVSDSGEGTAMAGVDYGIFSPQVLFFGAGSANSASRTFTVTPFDNGIIDAERTIVLNVAVAGAQTATSQLTLTLVDDEDPITVVLDNGPNFTRSEGNTASVQVRASTAGGAALFNAVTVTLSVSLGDAEEADYSLVGGASTTFAAGTPSGTVRSIPIQVVQDGQLELEETLGYTVAITSGTATFSGTDNGSVTLQDDERVQLAVSTADIVTPSESGSFEIEYDVNVVRDGGAAIGTGFEYPFTVSAVALAGGTLSPSDYTLTDDTTLSISAASPAANPGSLIVLITDDTIEEGEESVEFEIQAPPSVPLATADRRVRITVPANDAPVEVVPVYASNGANWNDYVATDGVDRFSHSGAACDATTAVYFDECVHAGELREFIVPGESDCAGIAATDSLGAFEWQCYDLGATIAVRSEQLRDTAGLRTLIDFTTLAWRDNVLTVTKSGAPLVSTTPGAWWSNSIVGVSLEGDASGGGSVGSQPDGTIVAATSAIVSTQPRSMWLR